MKLKKPKKTDYDFYAIHINGDTVSIVYADGSADDCEGAFPCYAVRKNGGINIAEGYLEIEAENLRVLPYVPTK